MELPPVILSALRCGAALAISVSGGKDSQAMQTTLVDIHRREAWPGALFAIHADLGRMDWPHAQPHCRKLTSAHNLPLVVVRREKGDLLAKMQERLEAVRGRGIPHWPSPAQRYCTSDLKTAPIDKRLRGFELVISAEGIRAEESPGRAKKPAVSVRKDITAERLKDLPPEEALAAWQPGKGRLALTWFPIHEWTLDQVWQACGTSQAELDSRRHLYRIGWQQMALAGWPCAEPYVFGASRLSCAICIMASKADIEVGAHHNPALHRALVEMERESGFTFQHRRALASVC